jgi:HK97 gp10 family phage protein
MPSIQVTGIRELRDKLRRLEKPTESTAMRAVLMDAADMVAVRARGKVPSRSGRAAGSIKATATATRAEVRGGSGVRYYGWLEFGSRHPRTGNPRSRGPWKGSGVGAPNGRFIYPSVDENATKVFEMVTEGLGRLIREAGL